MDDDDDDDDDGFWDGGRVSRGGVVHDGWCVASFGARKAARGGVVFRPGGVEEGIRPVTMRLFLGGKYEEEEDTKIESETEQLRSKSGRVRRTVRGESGRTDAITFEHHKEREQPHAAKRTDGRTTAGR